MFLCSDFLVQKTWGTGNFRPSLYTPTSDGQADCLFGGPCPVITVLPLCVSMFRAIPAFWKWVPCPLLLKSLDLNCFRGGLSFHPAFFQLVVRGLHVLLCPVILSLPWWSAVTGAAEFSFQIGPSFLAICLSAAHSYFLIESVPWSLGLVIGSWRSKAHID